MSITKLIKEHIGIVILVIVIIISTLFLGYIFFGAIKQWEKLSPEERQQIILTNERNYSYDYIDGVITDIDNESYWAGTHCCKTVATIYCAEMNETFTYEESSGAIDKPELREYKNGEHVKCERVTITNGYGNIVQQFLSKHIKLYD